MDATDKAEAAKRISKVIGGATTFGPFPKNRAPFARELIDEFARTGVHYSRSGMTLVPIIAYCRATKTAFVIEYNAEGDAFSIVNPETV